MKRTKLDIFEYTDFRKFLLDRITELQAEKPQYSRSYFCQRLGLASMNYLKLLIEGKRRLTDELAIRLTEVLGLTEQETAFFRDLVVYNQARTTEAKNVALKDLRLHRRFVKVQQMTIDSFDYIADPLTLTLRELTSLPDFNEDPGWIAAHLPKPATSKQIKDSLATLLRLGMLARDQDGVLRPAAQHQDTGQQLGSVPLRSYHLNMIKLSAEAMELPPTTRYFQGLTVSISPGAYARVVSKIQEAVEDVRRIVDEDEPSEQVYHLEVTFFPLSKRVGSADVPARS